MIVIIEKLDTGYIVTEKNKKKAVESLDKLTDIIANNIKEHFTKFDKTNCGNMMLEINVEYNLPTVKDN